jgi:hypothetical protein
LILDPGSIDNATGKHTTTNAIPMASHLRKKDRRLFPAKTSRHTSWPVFSIRRLSSMRQSRIPGKRILRPKDVSITSA